MRCHSPPCRYLCDNKFHTEDLNQLLESDDKFGFLIMDGNGSLFGTVQVIHCPRRRAGPDQFSQGSNREVLYKFSVDLPKKHGRGGQSSMRFARLRLEKRHNYLTKVNNNSSLVATVRLLISGC